MSEGTKSKLVMVGIAAVVGFGLLVLFTRGKLNSALSAVPGGTQAAK